MRPQWFPFDPTFLLPDWRNRNRILDMTVLSPWPEKIRFPDKRKLLSNYTELNSNPKMTEYQQYLHMLIDYIVSAGNKDRTVRFVHNRMGSTSNLWHFFCGKYKKDVLYKAVRAKEVSFHE